MNTETRTKPLSADQKDMLDGMLIEYCIWHYSNRYIGVGNLYEFFDLDGRAADPTIELPVDDAITLVQRIDVEKTTVPGHTGYYVHVDWVEEYFDITK